MENDATFEIMAGIGDKIPAAISLLSAPVYNIDDMDPKFCMADLRLTGCFCLRPDKAVDPARPGMVFINDQPTEPPLTLSEVPMFGQMIGIHCRRWLLEYDRDYDIRYTGAYDAEGMAIPEFRFTLHTASRCEPGERYPEHDAIVLQAAREGAVLLKNDNGALPLGKDATVNVFGAAAVMTGYNAANGSYCSDDAELLQGILREELGYDGYVMTDWGGYGDKGMPGLLTAGVSWIAPGSNDDTYVTPIVEALASGELSRGRVQDNLVRLVKALVRFPNSIG